MKKHYRIVRGNQISKRRFVWENKMVAGEIVDTVFGVRLEEGTGWRITHIPTGFLLVGTYFTTREDAIQFARITRRMFGDLLETDDIAVLKRIKNDKPEYRQFYDLKERMNNATGTFSFEEAVNL